ncbi:MAG TPA: histidine kinase [Ferruginibacter sp.]|nr:histidine kinase [Ferruginibacter sp.]
MRILILSILLLFGNVINAQSKSVFLPEPIYWWPVSLLLIFFLAILLLIFRRKNKQLIDSQLKNAALEANRTDQIKHQLELEQVVNYFTQSMYNYNSTEELLWDITRNCIAHLGFEDCVIYMVDKEKNVLLQKAAWGPKTTDENKIVNPLEIPIGKGIVGHVAHTGKAEIINDTLLDSRYIVDDLMRNAELTVPIIHNDKTIGIIDCEHSHKNFYTSRHLQIVETIAALAADRIQQIETIQAVHRQELHVASLKEKLAASQLTALRTQMNPHFIFNALNSVQQYILEGDVDKANRYLTKFSRLQREILQQCDQQFISLEKEIEMLNGYLEFEQLRFNENFEYRIEVAPEVEETDINIPPMLLQPYIENAIWHGLMPKQGTKLLHIGFSLLHEDILICIVEDNGIGVEASARLKQNSSNRHASKGMNLVKNRLEILQQQYNKPFYTSMETIRDDNGSIQGTRISLRVYIGS